MSKRKAVQETQTSLDGPGNMLEIMPLGAGNEVGRSCIILKYQGKTVMLDCGIHPGRAGLDSLPYFDSIDLAQVDVALITHFHLDHCAAVPYLVGKTKFKGRIFMTHPTKAIYHALLRDYVRVAKGSVDEQLYNDKDLEASMNRLEVVDFHQTVELSGIRVTPYRAGHVLGAAMFLVEIAGLNVLYTGDYSRVADRHLPAADLPHQRPHIVIVESTYGVSRHLPRDERERRFLDKVHSTVIRGGKVLLPVVALGRAQELLLLLDEYWGRHPELAHVPIYQASSLARKAISVYQTYIEMMNDDIKAAFHLRNPFNFHHVRHLRSSAQLDDSGACVVMATPSMLQSGVSRELFEQWCGDENNTCIIADFAVQGTLARDVLGAPATIVSRSGGKLPLRMSVEAISFSAHADYEQTSTFLDALAPPHVVLVHGEVGEMMRLRGALERNAAAVGGTRTVHTPKNSQAVQIEHQPIRVARALGRLAEKPAKPGSIVRGVLLSRNFTDTLLHPEDLPSFSKLKTGRVSQRQSLLFSRPFTDLRLALEVMFEGVEGSGSTSVKTWAADTAAQASTAGKEPTADGTEAAKKTGEESPAVEEQAVIVGNLVTVRHRSADVSRGMEAHVSVEWEGGSVADMLADAVIAVILGTAGEPAGSAAAQAAAEAARAAADPKAAATAELALMAALMRAQFGPAQVDEAAGTIGVQVGEESVLVDYKGGQVVCGDEHVRSRVEKALSRLITAMRPASLDDDL